MSTLQERLDRIRADFESKAPAEALDVIHRATTDLNGSGIMDRIPKQGAVLPEFELPDTEGQLVRSADLLSKGPMLATFYRGLW